MYRTESFWCRQQPSRIVEYSSLSRKRKVGIEGEETRWLGGSGRKRKTEGGRDKKNLFLSSPPPFWQLSQLGFTYPRCVVVESVSFIFFRTGQV